MVEGWGQTQQLLAVPEGAPVLMVAILVGNPGVEHHISDENVQGWSNALGNLGRPFAGWAAQTADGFADCLDRVLTHFETLLLRVFRVERQEQFIPQHQSKRRRGHAGANHTRPDILAAFVLRSQLVSYVGQAQEAA